jgi:hypothetical protein
MKMSKAFFINIISHFGIRQGVGVDIDYVRLFVFFIYIATPKMSE